MSEIPTTPADRLAFRMADLVALIGASRRALERWITSGQFPGPDRRLHRVPLWSRETVKEPFPAGSQAHRSLLSPVATRLARSVVPAPLSWRSRTRSSRPPPGSVRDPDLAPRIITNLEDTNETTR